MGKKYKVIVVSLLLVLFAVCMIPNSHSATFASLSLSGSGTATTGSEFTLDIYVTNTGSEKTMTMGGVVSIDNPSCVSFVSITGVADGVDAEGEMVSFFKTSGVSGNFSIAKVKLKAGSNACSTTVKITEATISSVSGIEEDLPTISKTITVNPPSSTPTKSNVATLNSLVPNKGSLSPSFSKNTTTYSLQVDSDVTNVTFTATVTDTGKATVSGTSCNLSSNPTACKIVVTAEDGTNKTYTVNVTKKTNQSSDPTTDVPEDKPGDPVTNKSSDATLTNIIISDNDGKTYSLSPSFDPNENTYSIKVSSIVSTLHITAPVSESHAKASIPSVTGLKPGNNVIQIPVTAEDGSINVYTINIYKEEESGSDKPTSSSKSSDNYIKELIINDGELKPSFNKTVSSYNITIPNEKTSLDLRTILSDSSASVKVTGNSDFKVCTKDNLYCNTVTIEVTAQDGSLRVYTINVNRSEFSGKNKLDRMEVTPGKLSPSFDPDVYDYEVDVDGDTDDIRITAIPQDSNSKVEIYGNENLKEGTNVVLIKVTDENGFVQYYRVNVNKAKKEDKKSSFLGLSLGQWLALLGILLFFGLFILFLFLFLKKKDKKEEDKAEASASPVIEFKPEINIGSRNNTDDDYVAEGAVLNQYDGKELPHKEEPKQIAEAEVKEIPYDMYDEIVTKDELFDAIQEATETKDSSKLKMLYAQEMLNREKEKLKEKDKKRDIED